MGSKVFFADFKAQSNDRSKVAKVARLCEAAGFKNLVSPGDLTAVKLHFGERGNDGFISPVFVRPVVDMVKAAQGKPFVTDTNTLYVGERHNAVDHLTVAIEHGFNYAVLQAPLIIADGLAGENAVDVPFPQGKHFSRITLARDIYQAQSMIVLSHFKGHLMAGFGGAVKNLAMGCCPATGKKHQHSLRPKVDRGTCVGCAKCTKVCPSDAIAVADKKATIDPKKCIGCGDCVSHCPVTAIHIDEAVETPHFLERMAEYARGAVLGKEKKTGYMNFVMNVTPDCDCCGFSDAPIVPDIGIFASDDPVALDQACLDAVTKAIGLAHDRIGKTCAAGEDKFLALRPKIDGRTQLIHAEALGLGSREYTLVKI